LQVKCIYHFRNEHGDSHDLYCYLHGWYDEKHIDLAHIFVGFDPCLVAKKDYMFSEYSEVSVEFQPEDINGNLLSLDLCQVHECGVRLLYEDGIHRFDLIMQGYFCFYPLDRDVLEAMFQAKRARFQCMRWDESFVMRWAYDQVCFSNLRYTFFFPSAHFKKMYLNCVNRCQKGHVVSASLEM
jgi:hypothetical protein